jgi:hypothetical protein
LIAQTTPLTPGSDPATATRLVDIALKRWFSGLTLSPHSPIPNLHAWTAWATAIAALAILALIVQKPAPAIAQFLDIPGHLRLVAASLGRFRRAGRLVAALCGAIVFSWTSWQALHHDEPRRLEDLAILLKSRSLSELTQEQAAHAALTPFRDLAGLADLSILLLIASLALFRLSAESWGPAGSSEHPDRPPAPAGTVFAWGAAWIYLIYRTASVALHPDGWPLNGLLGIDLALIPLVMLASDGLLLAWVLHELRLAVSDAPTPPWTESIAAALRGWLPATLAAAAALPARTAALTAWLALPYIPSPAPAPLRLLFRELFRGDLLIWLQAASLALTPLLAAAAWTRHAGRPGLLALTLILLQSQAGRLVAIILGGTVASAGLSALAYWTILSLPPQPWLLAAADAYAHFATLPAALLLLATLVELAGQATRPATPHPPNADLTPKHDHMSIAR